MIKFESSLLIAKKKMEESIWFKGWSPEQIENVLKTSHLRKFNKGDLVYRDGEESVLALLIIGAVWTCLKSQQDALKFGIAYPSILVGLSQLLSHEFREEPIYEFHAADESEALIIPRDAILSQLNSNPLLWRCAAEAAIFYQRHCIKLSLVLYTGSTKDRLISAIYQYGLSVYMQNPKASPREVRIPQEELAILIQSSRQHVNKALRELEAEGLVHVGYKRIAITDPTRLSALAIARIQGN